MRGHNICFFWEIRKIIFELSAILPLNWSSSCSAKTVHMIMLPAKSLDKKQNHADKLSRNHSSSKAVLAGGKRSWTVLAEPKYDRQSQQKPTMMDSLSIRKQKLADKFIPCARSAKTLKPENSTKVYVTASVTASPSNRPHALFSPVTGKTTRPVPIQDSSPHTMP